MDAKYIKEFASRSREPVELAKAEWWAARASSGNDGSSLAAGHALLEHARLVDPTFPSADYLTADLDHHIFLKKLLDDASKALARR